MKWSQPADRRVVEAVVATLRRSSRESGRELELRLTGLSESAWSRSYFWLDASGLTLYLLRRLEELGLEDAISRRTLGRLEESYKNNRQRSSEMFEEFVQLNREFQAAGVEYANLKGFTLCPESCPEPALRRAIDLDFLVNGQDLAICTEILERSGYRITGRTDRTWEFKAGVTQVSEMKNFYKTTPQRSAELHFAPAPAGSNLPGRDERLDRLTKRTLDGFDFPSLRASEQFVGQALHLFGHLCGASTRPSWLLEFANHAAFYRSDSAFWVSVKEDARAHRNAPIAIGLVCLLCAEIFGDEMPRELRGWTVDRLPSGVKRWAEVYGRRAVLTDFPGTKLYLILLHELKHTDAAEPHQKRQHLLPTSAPPRIVYSAPEDSLLIRLRKELLQARYVLYRLRFHVVEGIRYTIEAARWRWAMKQPAQAAPEQTFAVESTGRTRN